MITAVIVMVGILLGLIIICRGVNANDKQAQEHQLAMKQLDVDLAEHQGAGRAAK